MIVRNSDLVLYASAGVLKGADASGLIVLVLLSLGVTFSLVRHRSNRGGWEGN